MSATNILLKVEVKRKIPTFYGGLNVNKIGNWLRQSDRIKLFWRDSFDEPQRSQGPFLILS